MKQIIAFEYRRPENGDQEVSLHYNRADENGNFDSPLFTNGYVPLAVVEEEVTDHPDFQKLCDWLYDKAPAIQDAVAMTDYFIAGIYAKMGAR